MKKRKLPNCFVSLYCFHYYLAPLPFSFSQVHQADKRFLWWTRDFCSLLSFDLPQLSLGSNSSYPGEKMDKNTDIFLIEQEAVVLNRKSVDLDWS